MFQGFAPPPIDIFNNSITAMNRTAEMVLADWRITARPVFFRSQALVPLAPAIDLEYTLPVRFE